MSGYWGRGEGGNDTCLVFYLEVILKFQNLKLGQKKKNSCVSDSPTDPKISGPTLYFFFQKKNPKKFFFFFFLSFIQSPHILKLW